MSTNEEDDDWMNKDRSKKTGRILKGRSGNPRGRPRKAGEALPFELAQDVLKAGATEFDIVNKKTGRKEKMTGTQAMLKQLVIAGANGDKAAAKLYMAYLNNASRAMEARTQRLYDRLGAYLKSVDEGHAWKLSMPPGNTQGSSLAQVKAGLEQSRQVLGISSLDTGIFEAHAAAAAHVAFSEEKPTYFLIVDMGAGTTDIAGFERLERNSGIVMSELKPARQSCGLAGDELDMLIVGLMAAKRRTKSKEEASQFWRALTIRAREIKRELFEKGRASFQDKAGRVSIQRDEVLRAPDYQRLKSALAAIIEPSAKHVIEQARITNANPPSILLAGGGSNLGLLREATRLALTKAGGSGVAAIEQVGERWRLPAGSDDALRAVLPQLAISLGGALVELRDNE